MSENFIYPYPKYNTKEKRSRMLNLLKEKCKNKPFYNHKIWFVGYGCIGRPILLMLLNLCNIDPLNIILFDKRDLSNIYIPKGVVVRDKTEILKDNYLSVFTDLADNDIIVEASYAINTLDLLKLCQERGASHINSCIDIWDYKNIKTPLEYSLKYIHDTLDYYNHNIEKGKKNFNSIISMGCNPGNVSIWNKIGIREIWKKKFNIDTIPDKSFAELAHELGIQTIHISERDTQRTNNPKKINEYCNTWSTDGEAYYEELLGPVEASWGTHENKDYNNMPVVKYDKRYMIWKKMGAYVYAQSWVPIYGRYIGNIIRHDEAYTIGRYLTIKNKYNPSVYYVYHPTNDTMESVHELKERNHNYQNNYRNLTKEITDGRDLLGLTYYLEDGTTYFIGSLLDINEAREIYNNKYNDFINATNVQVVGGYLSGILSLMKLNEKNVKLGLMCPDELPYDKLIEYQLPLIGDFVFVEGTCIGDLMKCKNNLITSNNEFGSERNMIRNGWTFDKFLV